MMNQPYEDGGIAGPRRKAILDLLQDNGGSAGGQAPIDQLAPDQATAMAHRNQPGNPFASIIGGMGPQAGPTLPGPAPVPGANDFPGGEPTQAPTQLPAAYSKVAPSGWDQTKWDDPNHKSAKYAMRQTLDPFNAQQGFTPEAIAALNALGYGNFSGNGQRLSLSGLTDKGRQAGLSGDYQGADFINSYQNGGNAGATWGYSDPVAEAAEAQSQPQARGGGGSIGALGGVNALLQGDPTAKIQAELQALINGSQSPVLRNAIQQMLGGR